MDSVSNQVPANTQDNSVQKTADDFFGISLDDIIGKDIFELLGAKDMPPEKQAELYNAMLDTVRNRVITRIDGVLSDDEVVILKEILTNKDQIAFENFIKDKNIDLEQYFTQEALLYKMQLIDLMKSREE